MTDRENIKNIVELFIAWNGETEVIDIANLDSAVDFIIDSLPEEPVSEELLDTTQTITYNGEVYIRRYKDELDAFACKYPMSVPKTSKKYAKYSDVDLTIAVKAGAQWQKEVFEKNRLAACDRATKEEIEREQDFVDKVLIGEQRQPTFSDAIEYGIKWQKKQTIDKACKFLVDAGKYIKYNPIDDEYKFNAQQLVKDFRKYMEE